MSTPEIIRIDQPGKDREAVAQVAALLRRGGLVAFPTETVYGVGAIASNPDAVRRIYEAKGRPPTNPLTYHLASAEGIGALVREVPAHARLLVEHLLPGPLTLIFERGPSVPDYVTAGMRKVGVRVPMNAVAQAILRAVGEPVVATSANLSGRPTATTVRHVQDDIGEAVDAIVETDECPLGIESTVVDVVTNPVRILRPGFVTREDLSGFLDRPPVLSEDNYLEPDFPKYQPRGRLVLIEGAPDRVLARMLDMARGSQRGGKVGFLVSEELAAQVPAAYVVKATGSRTRVPLMAQNLFRMLRELDEEKCALILAEGLPRQGLGAALMHRLGQAASLRIQADAAEAPVPVPLEDAVLKPGGPVLREK